MTPADRSSAMELRRLVRDTEADLSTLKKLHGEVERIASRPPGLGDETQAFLGVRLHAWYTAFESILEGIARTLEGCVRAPAVGLRGL